ncbi:MAG: prephenate dehydratase domain-containing protein [Candidatus Dasytiphilus stammeri]
MHNVHITFLGPKGTYSHLAAHKYAQNYFKTFLESSCCNFYLIFKKVETGQADYAIVPLENSSSGSIKEIYKLLARTELYIIGEIILPIEHCMLVSANTHLHDIETIYSHAQPFQQCSLFMKNFSTCKLKYTLSTAAAMTQVASLQSPKVAAIGSEEGGKYYNLQVIATNISNKSNTTRFIILSRESQPVESDTPAKTTLFLSQKKKSIFLRDTTVRIVGHQNIITHLRCISANKQFWEDLFYLDLKNHLTTTQMQQDLIKIKDFSRSIRILGCYPRDKKTELLPYPLPIRNKINSLRMET